MNRFRMFQPESIADALVCQSRGGVSLPVLKAGGVDVIDHLKEGLIEPKEITSLSQVRERAIRKIGSSSLGALCTLSQLAGDEMLQRLSPVIAQAAAATGTPQVRNAATLAGNLLQRPRCWYYRRKDFNCLKKGGHHCFAVEGDNRYHAIFGDGPCHIVHPSNLANALSVCNGRAMVVKPGSNEQREIPMRALFAMPDRRMFSEHVLEADEIVVQINFRTEPRSAHYEIREKQSFDWPLVMVSVALQLQETRIAGASICAGAVAPVPWMLEETARALVGVDVEDEKAIRAACERSTHGAKPMSDNAFKLQLLPVAVHRAVRLAAGLPIDDLFHHHRL